MRTVTRAARTARAARSILNYPLCIYNNYRTKVLSWWHRPREACFARASSSLFFPFREDAISTCLCASQLIDPTLSGPRKMQAPYILETYQTSQRDCRAVSCMEIPWDMTRPPDSPPSSSPTPAPLLARPRIARQFACHAPPDPR